MAIISMKISIRGYTSTFKLVLKLLPYFNFMDRNVQVLIEERNLILEYKHEHKEERRFD